VTISDCLSNKLSFQLILDYETPPEKEFNRGLEATIQRAVEFLNSCRPFAVSMTNALRHIKNCILLEDSSKSDQEVSLVLLL
jgi:translation initiation factor eIF-2B subunit delta